MAALRHELISASAGSGKTFQLVRRYLHLLALGVKPETVVALTFTRKAAGEFFGRILSKLARLADGTEDAESYFAGLSPAVPAGTDCGLLLKQLTRCMHKLRLGTLDSFFASVATCFPLELGLAANAAVMDETDTLLAQNRTLEALLDELHSAGNDAAVRQVTQSVKQASFGLEEKRLEDILRGWVKDNHELWLDSAGAAVWGNPAVFWRGAGGWLEEMDSAQVTQAAEELRDAFPKTTPTGQEELDLLVKKVGEVNPGVKPVREVAYFLKKSAEIWEGLRRGSAAVTWQRGKVVIEGAAAAAWVRLAELLLNRELLVRVQRTRGLAAFLDAYEQRYQKRVRNQGLLSFADIPRLLGGAAQAWQREEMWFRLDGRFDHWMLDEFQDTSFKQWRITQPLVDEVLQDTGGERSFFAVGDIKQSIYVWRQAEPGLFNEVKNYGAGKIIQVSTLAKSYRSAQPVLDAVNTVFDDGAALEALLPGSTRDWEFTRHEASDETLTGCARFFSTTAAEPSAKDDDADEAAPAEDGDATPVQRAAAALLREIDPPARGLSCAVLVRSNKNASSFAAALRSLTGMDVVTESAIHPVTDNAVTLALLSLLQLAAHPGDTLALEHLRMTPLGAVLGLEVAAVKTAAAQTAREVFEHGFAKVLTRVLKRLDVAGIALDPFHQRRVDQMLEFAGVFDEEGGRDIDLFIQGASDYETGQPGQGSAIQVMTVHKSKGLEFDVVILPDLEGSGMNKIRHRNWIVHRERGEVRWVLQSPNSAYVPLNPTLGAEQQESNEQAGFESMCRLYVAMTRAKRGLYFIAAPPPQKSSSMKESRFLRSRFAASGQAQGADVEVGGEPLLLEWETGDIDWHLSVEKQEPKAPEIAAPDLSALGEAVRRNQPSQRRLTPSGEESFRIPGSVLFSPGRETGRQLGLRVHELMAGVAWWQSGDDLQTLLDLWRGQGLVEDEDETGARALEWVRQLLESEAGQQALRQPEGGALLWREKPFDFIDGGDWVSGVFDRVVVRLDEAGGMVSAQVLDFKTDEVNDEAALEEKVRGYAPQLALYRRAVARLTGLKDESVASSLVFLRPPRLVPVT